MTRELARLIKGELSVESVLSTEDRPGGSTFRLHLPAGIAHVPEDVLDWEAPPVSSSDIDLGYSRKAIADEMTTDDIFEGGVDYEDSIVSDSDLIAEREAAILLVDDNAGESAWPIDTRLPR